MRVGDGDVFRVVGFVGFGVFEEDDLRALLEEPALGAGAVREGSEVGADDREPRGGEERESAFGFGDVRVREPRGGERDAKALRVASAPHLLERDDVERRARGEGRDALGDRLGAAGDEPRGPGLAGERAGHELRVPRQEGEHAGGRERRASNASRLGANEK